MRVGIVLTLAAIALCTSAAKPTVVYRPGEAGYYCFRIPALLTLPVLKPEGSPPVLLAFAEARKYSCSDAGYIDLVVRRSTDSGATWGPIQLVKTASNKTANVTIGNPAPALLTTGRSNMIILPYTRNNRDAWVIVSSNDGRTWSKPEALPVNVGGQWSWVAAGPPGSIVAYYGGQPLVVIPGDHDTVSGGQKQGFSHVWTGLPGKGWKLAGSIPGGNECQAVQLANESLLMTMRSAFSKYHNRLFSVSNDKGATWSPARVDTSLPDPVCEASMEYLPIDDSIVLSNIANATGRQNLVLSKSSDSGATWKKVATIWPDGAAYSSIKSVGSGHSNEVGCLFEPLNYDAKYKYGYIFYSKIHVE